YTYFSLIIVFLFYAYAVLWNLHSFPTRRSSDLPAGVSTSTSKRRAAASFSDRIQWIFRWVTPVPRISTRTSPGRIRHAAGAASADRKSTRLNSSHLGISYAVFCLKKKNNKNNTS